MFHRSRLRRLGSPSRSCFPERSRSPRATATAAQTGAVVRQNDERALRPARRRARRRLGRQACASGGRRRFMTTTTAPPMRSSAPRPAAIPTAGQSVPLVSPMGESNVTGTRVGRRDALRAAQRCDDRIQGLDHRVGSAGAAKTGLVVRANTVARLPEAELLELRERRRRDDHDGVPALGQLRDRGTSCERGASGLLGLERTAVRCAGKASQRHGACGRSDDCRDGEGQSRQRYPATKSLTPDLHDFLPFLSRSPCCDLVGGRIDGRANGTLDCRLPTAKRRYR